MLFFRREAPDDGDLYETRGRETIRVSGKLFSAPVFVSCPEALTLPHQTPVRGNLHLSVVVFFHRANVESPDSVRNAGLLTLILVFLQDVLGRYKSFRP